MNQTYYIFRHGKAIADGEEYGDKILSASLLPESVPVIKRVAEFLKTVPESKNFSSEILRCKQTAEIVTSIIGKQFTFDRRLNEFYQESFTELSKRVELFLEEVCYSENGPFVICTHGAVISAMKHLILTKTYTLSDLYDYIQPGEMLIIKANKEIEILNFN